MLAALAGLPDGRRGLLRGRRVGGQPVGPDGGPRHRRATGAAPSAPPQPLVASSEEAHSSVGKALHVLGVGRPPVPSHDHRLTGAALPTALDATTRAPTTSSPSSPRRGTTNAGIVDDLAGVADVAARPLAVVPRRRRLRRCAALFAPSARHRFAGFEQADSFIVDPHKWLFAPFDCAALLYRRARTWPRRCTPRTPQYLDVLHSENPEEWNPSDYAFHLTRRARGLPLWFSLAVNGLDAYRDAVEAGLAIAQQAAERIERSPHVELVRDPELSIVLFRRPGWDKADYESWSARLLNDQIGFVTPTCGRASRSPASPSSTPTPTWRWSTRSSPPWPDGPKPNGAAGRRKAVRRRIRPSGTVAERQRVVHHHPWRPCPQPSEERQQRRRRPPSGSVR